MGGEQDDVIVAAETLFPSPQSPIMLQIAGSKAAVFDSPVLHSSAFVPPLSGYRSSPSSTGHQSPLSGLFSQRKEEPSKEDADYCIHLSIEETGFENLE